MIDFHIVRQFLSSRGPSGSQAVAASALPGSITSSRMQAKHQRRQSSHAGRGQLAGEAAPDLRSLVGVRALASIGVVVLHSYMLWQFFLDHHTKYELTRSNALIK